MNKNDVFLDHLYQLVEIATERMLEDSDDLDNVIKETMLSLYSNVRHEFLLSQLATKSYRAV